MFSPLRTALVATVLSGMLCGAAQANNRPAQILPSDIVLASLEVSDQAGPTQREFTIPANVRHQLMALEGSGNMPNANADLQMWGGAGSLRADSMRSAQMRRFTRGIISRTSSIAMSLTRSALRFIGTPYVFGGTSSSGFDCSGYTQHVFAMLGIEIPRTADAQYYAGKPVVGGMRTGDLVFFQTYLPGPSHVGIYMGHDKFISSSGRGVSISSLHDSYWHARYIGAKRFVAVR